MGRDQDTLIHIIPVLDFNPLSPHGERRSSAGAAPPCSDFNPLSPHGERPVYRAKDGKYDEFQSTLPAWGETGARGRRGKRAGISIHSPRMGRDRRKSAGACCRLSFQSTLPAWGETLPLPRSLPVPHHFNPLSPHGERRKAAEKASTQVLFQSTLPAWGETGTRGPHLCRVSISIHSPRMGRDSKRTQLFEEKNWRICTTLYLFASKGVLPADKKTF